ncbi:peptide-methionine (R)-S-oxide reductase MsrB [Candidatus Saccharibacteria bacterium]|nr:peptide-methionine (R)-S-oxide reductase MsrB [Candidatus Saccharibacteria bacterium]
MKQINPKLTDEQKDVLFNKATEAPFTGTFLYNEEDGDYVCANCGSVLFGAETKFDAGCGWPSFYDVRDTKAIKLIEDTSHGMHRVEVVCRKCDGHLGHVFNDAPDQPTGMRFCINSLSLDFIKNKM